MATRRPRHIPLPRLWNAEQLSGRLNRSPRWLDDNLPRLLSLGMPPRDPVFGEWDSEAVERWLDRRSGLVAPSAHDEEEEALSIIRTGRR